MAAVRGHGDVFPESILCLFSSFHDLRLKRDKSAFEKSISPI